MTPGQQLDQLRVALGVSIVDAARAAGVTRRTWHRWAAGRVVPSPHAIDAVCRSWGVDEISRIVLIASAHRARPGGIDE